MTTLARTPQQIGNAIRRARRQRGLNQAALGERAGLRQATVSLIETGHPAARIDTLLGLLAALDLEFRIAPRSRGTVDAGPGADALVPSDALVPPDDLAHPDASIDPEDRAD
jgi:HTH-type transcriptional regulator/antitoxin HipB